MSSTTDPSTAATPLRAGATVAWIGLGNMGAPMAGRLADAGYAVRGHDVDAEVAAAFAAGGERRAAAQDAVAASAGADVVVLMLPSSAVVQAVAVDGGLLAALAPGTLLLDMGSSEPTGTRALAAAAAERGVRVVDAPVSGGVGGAVKGALTIMVGGAEADVAAARPLLDVLGSRVLHVGAVAAGHALKALNNLLSATHLLASAEALEVGERFGIDPAVLLDAINTSSGRSGSTERKLPDFVLPGGYDSGFGLQLMLKDMRIAVGLAEATGAPARLGEAAVALWADAADELADDADHTEIARWVHERLTGGR